MTSTEWYKLVKMKAEIMTGSVPIPTYDGYSRMILDEPAIRVTRTRPDVRDRAVDTFVLTLPEIRDLMPIIQGILGNPELVPPEDTPTPHNGA